MGQHRTSGKFTLVGEIARACLEKTPAYPGNAWLHSSVQIGDSFEPNLFWIRVDLRGVTGHPYRLQGTVSDWSDPSLGGTCEVAERVGIEGGADDHLLADTTFVFTNFTWRMVDFKIEVTLVEITTM